MKLLIERKWPKADYTVGRLYVDGKFFCNTLEDTVRDLSSGSGAKLPGRTAIPAGTYRVTLDVVSPKYSNFARYPWAKPYGGRVPRLLDVPLFEGILIHPGNTPADTAGCILVGENSAPGRVVRSVDTFRRLMDECLLPARAGGITVEIR